MKRVSIALKEGKVKKGGLNSPPTTERPDPPKGQGGSDKCEVCRKKIEEKTNDL
jgi:hypothetical protein